MVLGPSVNKFMCVLLSVSFFSLGPDPFSSPYLSLGIASAAFAFQTYEHLLAAAAEGSY